MMTRMKKILLSLCLVVFSGCAFMHHTQIGEIDSSIVLRGQRFEVLVNETGFSTQELASTGAAIARASGNSQSANEIQGVGEIIALFQMGPKTGKPTFTDQYADNIYYAILDKCPSGRVSGITSIREMAHYPIVSGEIVKIIGYCKR